MYSFFCLVHTKPETILEVGLRRSLNWEAWISYFSPSPFQIVGSSPLFAFWSFNVGPIIGTFLYYDTRDLGNWMKMTMNPS